MKCVVCEHRKAKRPCPAKDSLICPQCCGEKRVLEIDCPEACEFLQAGRARESSQIRELHFRRNPLAPAKLERLLEEFEEFLGTLEFLIAEERRSSRDLKDEDVAAALDLVLQTLRTEQKGILYVHTSSDLRVESLRRQLHEMVHSIRHPSQKRRADPYSLEDTERRPIRLEDAIECLELVRGFVQMHLDSSAPLRYVDFLIRLLPSRLRLDERGSSLIVPGR
jgi:hypothetical protein